MIQIRDVPEGVHRTLKARAAVAGMSLSDYIKKDLERAAAQPTIEEIDVRVRSRSRTGISTESILGALSEQRG
jgi:plasmid stability protein